MSTIMLRMHPRRKEEKRKRPEAELCIAKVEVLPFCFYSHTVAPQVKRHSIITMGIYLTEGAFVIVQ